jgi:hypothetical protein
MYITNEVSHGDDPQTNLCGEEARVVFEATGAALGLERS